MNINTTLHSINKLKYFCYKYFTIHLAIRDSTQTMNKNFEYIKLKDRKKEWVSMSGEDCPQWNCQHLIIQESELDLKDNEYYWNSILVGFYLLEKFSIKEEYNIGDGLGISKQGMTQPIHDSIKNQNPKCKNGIGFYFNRTRKYPNRKCEFIVWVTKPC